MYPRNLVLTKYVRSSLHVSWVDISQSKHPHVLVVNHIATHTFREKTEQQQQQSKVLFLRLNFIVIFQDFHSTKQGLPLVDSWSQGLD